MANDAQEILGKWTVRFKQWTWEYLFTADGKVNWRDPYNNEHGSGRWAMSPQLINLSWNGSATKESWKRSIKPLDQDVWYDATYGKGWCKAQKIIASTSQELPPGTRCFVKPSFASAEGASVTPDGRQWRQELDRGGRALIGIKGIASWNEIDLRFNNDRIAAIEKESPVSEHVSDIRVTFKVIGLEPGDAELTAFADGASIASMQIHVRERASAQATYVDNFMQGFYDPDFRSQGGNWSKYVIVRYHDDVVLAIHIDQIGEERIDLDTKASYINQGEMGEGGRRFPLKMTASTTPNLYALKRQAIEKMSMDFIAFMKVAKEAIIFVLSVGEAARSMLGNTFRQMARRDAPAPVRKVMEQGASLKRIQGKDVTEEVIRNAMKDAPLKSQQKGGISLPKVQEFVDKLNAGETPPPIKVDEGIIVEGNHRYIAGRIYGKEPPIQPWAGGRPERVVSWDQMPISKSKW